MSDFIAQHALFAPNTYHRGYNEGDTVSAQVVENWGLQVPDDVVPAEGYQPPRPAEDSTDRALWEAYVVGQGTSMDDARAASLDELRAMYDAPPEPEPPAHDLPANAAPEGVDGTGVTSPTPVEVPGPATPADGQGGPERPAQSARKAEWVDYVIAAGADEEWARADDTTKDDLIEWKPDGS